MIRYDRTIFSTKLTGSQLSLPHGTNRKLTKNKLKIGDVSIVLGAHPTEVTICLQIIALDVPQ